MMAPNAAPNPNKQQAERYEGICIRVGRDSDLYIVRGCLSKKENEVAPNVGKTKYTTGVEGQPAEKQQNGLPHNNLPIEKDHR